MVAVEVRPSPLKKSQIFMLTVLIQKSQFESLVPKFREMFLVIDVRSDVPNFDASVPQRISCGPIAARRHRPGFWKLGTTSQLPNEKPGGQEW